MARWKSPVSTATRAAFQGPAGAASPTMALTKTRTLEDSALSGLTISMWFPGTTRQSFLANAPSEELGGTN